MEKDQKETRVVLMTQNPVLVVIAEQSVPSIGHCLELCVCVCPAGRGKWLAVLEGRDLEVRQTEVCRHSGSLAFIHSAPSTQTGLGRVRGGLLSWLTLQSPAAV